MQQNVPKEKITAPKNDTLLKNPANTNITPQPVTTQPIVQMSTTSSPTTDYMYQAKQLAQQYGIDSNLFNEIQKKAENNIAMYEPTAQKQAIYDSLQNYYMTEIQRKASIGQALDTPNAWKQQMYNQAQSQSLNNQAQTNVSPMQAWLEKAAQEQLKAQESQLGLSRDQQLAEIDKALQDAVNRGQLSIKEAEAQYEKAKQGIYQQAYQDSELTNHVAQSRGIQNSAQMVGLMQGDQARRNSLLNENVTVRDQQINAINNQLDQMRYNSAIDKSMANSTYNYGLANAQGQIYSDMYNNMASMSFDEYQRLASQQFQQQQTQDERKYQFEMMAKQQGYDLEKMSAQQKYALEQMFNQYQYSSMDREDSQSFQAQQSSYDRNHQILMQNNDFNYAIQKMYAEDNLSMIQYDRELERLLSRYTPGTDEYKALSAERDWARQTAEMENQMNFLSELNVSEITRITGMFPKEMPNPTDKKAVEAFNSQIEYVNKQLTDLLGKEGSEQYIRDLYKGKTGASDAESKKWYQKLTETLMKWNPVGIVPRTVYNALTP